MSPPSSGDASPSDDVEPSPESRHPPTRRAVLTALATTGCLGIGGGSRTGPTTSNDTATDRAPSTTPNDGIPLRVTNVSESERDLRISVGEDGEHLDESLTLEAGSGHMLTTVSPGRSYALAVEDLTANRDGYATWRVEGALRAMEIRVAADEIRFLQSATCTPGCDPVSTGGDAVSLPYRREGAAEVSRPGRIDVDSSYEESDSTLSLVVRDGDTTVLDYDYRLRDEWSLTIPNVVATKGWYSIEATVGDQTTEWDWHVASNWPRAVVRVDSTGIPRIGCGTDPQPLLLENHRSESATIDISLSKRGDEVWAGPITLAADSELRLTPIELGDDLTVEARLGERVATGEYVTCACRGGETTVTVDESVTVSSHVAVCD